MRRFFILGAGVLSPWDRAWRVGALLDLPRVRFLLHSAVESTYPLTTPMAWWTLAEPTWKIGSDGALRFSRCLVE